MEEKRAGVAGAGRGMGGGGSGCPVAELVGPRVLKSVPVPGLSFIYLHFYPVCFCKDLMCPHKRVQNATGQIRATGGGEA